MFGTRYIAAPKNVLTGARKKNVPPVDMDRFADFGTEGNLTTLVNSICNCKTGNMVLQILAMVERGRDDGAAVAPIGAGRQVISTIHFDFRPLQRCKWRNCLPCSIQRNKDLISKHIEHSKIAGDALNAQPTGFILKKNLDTGKIIHINLETDIMSKWATLIMTGDAVVHGPPCNVEEFDKLITNAMNSKEKKSSNSEFSTEFSMHQGQSGHGAPQVVYNYNMAPTPSPCSETPSLKTSPKTHFLSLLSPIHEIDPKEYNTTGLEAFMDYCYEKYGDYEFLEALHSLQEKKLGVDLLKDVDANILKSECGLTHGTALRIIKCYPVWKESLSNVPFPSYILILQ
jgi:hypothetical protein